MNKSLLTQASSKRRREEDANNAILAADGRIKLPSRQLGRRGTRIAASRSSEEDHHYIVVPTSIIPEWKGMHLGEGLLPLDAQLSNEPGHAVISVGTGITVRIQYRTGGNNPTELFKEMEDHLPTTGFVLHLFGRMNAQNGGFAMGNNVVLTPPSIENIQLGEPWKKLLGLKIYNMECPLVIMQKLSKKFTCPVYPGTVQKGRWVFNRRVEVDNVTEIHSTDNLDLHKFYVPSGILNFLIVLSKNIWLFSDILFY